MPFVVHCPACRSPLSVAESPLAYATTCPSCHRPLTVPAVAPVPEARPVRPPRERGRARTYFFVFVGVLVAVVMGMAIYDRVEASYDRARLDQINGVLPGMIFRWDRMADDAPGKQKLAGEIDQLEDERRRILRAHPDWRR